MSFDYSLDYAKLKLIGSLVNITDIILDLIKKCPKKKGNKLKDYLEYINYYIIRAEGINVDTDCIYDIINKQLKSRTFQFRLMHDGCKTLAEIKKEIKQKEKEGFEVDSDCMHIGGVNK